MPASSRLVPLTVLSLLLLSAAARADWPGWRGPNRDGKSFDTKLLHEWPADGPRLLWQNSGVGVGVATVAIVGNRIFTCGGYGSDEFLLCLDAAGKEQWRALVGPLSKDRTCPGAKATPVVDGGNVYVESGIGTVVCFAAADGKRLWAVNLAELGGREPTWSFSESPLLVKDLCIVTPGGSAAIVALDKKSGQVRWRSSGFAAAPHYSSPIAVNFEGLEMIVQGTGGGLFAVNAKDGSLLWQDDWCKGNTANCPTPAYADGYVFWANGYGKGGVCLKLARQGNGVTATRAWTTREMDCHHGGFVIDQGYIFGNHGGGWICLDLKTGQKQWQSSGVGKGSLCYADGQLYTFGENGGRIGLIDADPRAFRPHGQFAVKGSGPSWAHPVVDGGRLFLRYANNLYCFDVRGK